MPLSFTGLNQTDMTKGKYVLDAKGNPVLETDLMVWAAWLETGNRRVAATFARGHGVSTVFLGLDYNYDLAGPPVLWESMIFGGTLNNAGRRCAGSREQAEAMHADMVTIARQDYSLEPWFNAKPRKRRRHELRQLRRKYYGR